MKNKTMKKIRDIPFILLGYFFVILSTCMVLFFTQPLIWFFTDQSWKEAGREAIVGGVALALFLELPFVGWLLPKNGEETC